MTRIIRHVLFPAIASAAIIGLYFTPVSVIGCADRGLAALAIVMVSLLVGIAAAIQAIRTSRLDREASGWYAISAALLAIPAALVLGPLG